NFPDSLVLPAAGDEMLPGDARPVGGGGARGGSSDEPRLGHRHYAGGPIFAPSYAGNRGDSGRDAGEPGWPESSCRGAAGIRVFGARHYGELRRFVMPVSGVAGTCPARKARSRGAAQDGGGGPFATELAVCANVGRVAAGGVHTRLLFSGPLGVVRMAGDCSANGSALVVRPACAARWIAHHVAGGAASRLVQPVPVGAGSFHDAAGGVRKAETAGADALPTPCLSGAVRVDRGLGGPVHSEATRLPLGVAVCASVLRDVVRAAPNVSVDGASGTAGTGADERLGEGFSLGQKQYACRQLFCYGSAIHGIAR